MEGLGEAKNILMRITIVSLLFLFISVTAFSQSKKHTYTPIWKKGDVREVLFVTTEKEMENDTITLDSISYLDAKIKVLEANKTDYLLKITMTDIAMESTIDIYKTLGKGVPPIEDVKILCRIDRKTGEKRITNWKKIQEFAYQNIDNIIGLVGEEDAELSDAIRMIFQPIKDLYSSREAVEALFLSQFEFLFMPLHKPINTKDIYSVKIEEENPFSPTETMTSETQYIIEEINKSNRIAKIRSEKIIDLSGFIEMVKSLMHTMGESLGADEEAIEENNKEFDDFDIEMKNHQYVNYNYKTGWPVSASYYAEVITNEPGKKNVNITTMKITIK